MEIDVSFDKQVRNILLVHVSKIQQRVASLFNFSFPHLDKTQSES
jgi:hypothetical protein